LDLLFEVGYFYLTSNQTHRFAVEKEINKECPQTGHSLFVVGNSNGVL